MNLDEVIARLEREASDHQAASLEWSFGSEDWHTHLSVMSAYREAVRLLRDNKGGILGRAQAEGWDAAIEAIHGSQQKGDENDH